MRHQNETFLFSWKLVVFSLKLVSLVKMKLYCAYWQVAYICSSKDCRSVVTCLLCNGIQKSMLFPSWKPVLYTQTKCKQNDCQYVFGNKPMLSGVGYSCTHICQKAVLDSTDNAQRISPFANCICLLKTYHSEGCSSIHRWLKCMT